MPSISSCRNYRFETVRRRSKHRLEKVDSRDHVVVGMLVALKRIDEVCNSCIKSSCYTYDVYELSDVCMWCGV